MKKKLTINQKLRYCRGCEDDFYNSGGNSLRADGRCWSIDNAELVMKKKVPLDQYPPWNQPPVKVLSCYHQRGYVFIDKDRTC